MAVQTPAEADTELQTWYAARAALVEGKSFTITTSAGTRQLTRNSLAEVQRMIEKLERRASSITGGHGHNFALAAFDDPNLQE